MGEKLRLRATDVEDLAVIAACLQDAKAQIREMAYLPDERRFMAAFTRYRRELQPDPTSCDNLTEIEAALVLEGIEAVKFRGIDPARPEQELTLLTIATMPGAQHLFHIELVFEGDAEIQLRTDRLDCRLDDFGAARPCKVTPCDHFATPLPGWTEPYAETS